MPLKRLRGVSRSRLAAARVWLENAATELALASTIARPFPSRACFHAHQCCGLALKAAAIALAGDHTRTHVGGALAAELAALGVAIPGNVETAANRLDQFYIGSRYPDALGGADPRYVLGELDARGAIALAENVPAFATRTVAGEATA